MSLFGSLVNLVENTARVVTAPVEIVVDLADAVVAPLAEAADEIVKDVKSIKDG